MEKVKIEGSYITITQLLKMYGYIDSGGQAKYFLKEHDVFLNGIKVTERGKKIVNQDQVNILNHLYLITI